VDASTFRFGAVAESAPHNRNNHPLVSRCSKFSYVEVADVHASGTRLCQHLDAAESKVGRALGKHTFAKAVKKQRRSTTPPEEMGAAHEAKVAKQEGREEKRAHRDVDYKAASSSRSLSD